MVSKHLTKPIPLRSMVQTKFLGLPYRLAGQLTSMVVSLLLFPFWPNLVRTTRSRSRHPAMTNFKPAQLSCWYCHPHSQSRTSKWTYKRLLPLPLRWRSSTPRSTSLVKPRQFTTAPRIASNQLKEYCSRCCPGTVTNTWTQTCRPCPTRTVSFRSFRNCWNRKRQS
jgi:hypothetical protein